MTLFDVGPVEAVHVAEPTGRRAAGKKTAKPKPSIVYTPCHLMRQCVDCERAAYESAMRGERRNPIRRARYTRTAPNQPDAYLCVAHAETRQVHERF